ncbi:PAS domain-containing protein [Nonomuraea antimicrobica]
MAQPRDSEESEGAANASSRLDDLLIEAVFGARAHLGVVYVLNGSGQLMKMESAIGIPVSLARTWARVRVNDSIPVAVSVREQRLIWLSDRVAMAREFPVAALSLPYHFALATAPISTGDAVWGGFVMGWPTGGESELSQRRLDVITDICARMGGLLRTASEEGRPIVPRSEPRVLNPARTHGTGEHTGLTALACLNSLPEGYCHLDAHARVTLVTASAAELLGAKPSDLVGRRLSKNLPWLDNPSTKRATAPRSSATRPAGSPPATRTGGGCRSSAIRACRASRSGSPPPARPRRPQRLRRARRAASGVLR